MKTELVIFDFYRTLFNPETEKENKGANELLKIIKGKKIKICICSSKEKGNEERETLIARQTFIQYVNKIYFAFREDKEKKYQQAIKDFNCSVDKTIVVGDYLERDLKPALKIGCRSVWFKHGKFSSETPQRTGIYPMYTIHRLSELLNLIK